MYIRHGDGVDDLDRDDFTFEWFTGGLWALAVLHTIEVLRKCLEIGLAAGISEQKGAGVEGTAEQRDVAFVDSLEIGVGEYAGNVGGVCRVIVHTTDVHIDAAISHKHLENRTMSTTIFSCRQKLFVFLNLAS
jgi:hypothetical protein